MKSLLTICCFLGCLAVASNSVFGEVTTWDAFITNNLTIDQDGNTGWQVDKTGWTTQSWVWSQDHTTTFFNGDDKFFSPAVDAANGGIVFKFQTNESAMLAVNILADYQFGYWAGCKIVLYFSDQNDWDKLSPMSGSRWAGGGEDFETDPNWIKLDNHEDWSGTYYAQLDGRAVSTDGIFYVRVDLTTLWALPDACRLHNLSINGTTVDLAEVLGGTGMPEIDPQTQVVKGNVVDFTPDGSGRARWQLGNGTWIGGSEVAREFHGEAYTYNSYYVSHDGSLTSAWCEEGTPGIGGIVWHFKASDPAAVAAHGGMTIDGISAIYEFVQGNAGNVFQIYYSDNNNWSNLITDYNPVYGWDYTGMTGGCWSNLGGNPPEHWTGNEYNQNWVNVYSNRIWGGAGTYNLTSGAINMPDGKKIISTDGDFWVRVDLGLFDFYIWDEQPATNALDKVMLKELKVAGRYSTCNDLVQNGLNIAGDADGNCQVDLLDLAKLAGDWMSCYDPQDVNCTEKTNW